MGRTLLHVSLIRTRVSVCGPEFRTEESIHWNSLESVRLIGERPVVEGVGILTLLLSLQFYLLGTFEIL